MASALCVQKMAAICFGKANDTVESVHIGPTNAAELLAKVMFFDHIANNITLVEFNAHYFRYYQLSEDVINRRFYSCNFPMSVFIQLFVFKLFQRFCFICRLVYLDCSCIRDCLFFSNVHVIIPFFFLYVFAFNILLFLQMNYYYLWLWIRKNIYIKLLLNLKFM